MEATTRAAASQPASRSINEKKNVSSSASDEDSPAENEYKKKLKRKILPGYGGKPNNFPNYPKYHPHSKWQEPYNGGPNIAVDSLLELTMYERNRKPRPIVSGVIQRPLDALHPEFRCVICLGFIQNTKVVMECLHRFCADCIETSLRKGRHECPICRVFVPSRRSLAPDPTFDRLIRSILGPDPSALTDDAEQSQPTIKNIGKRWNGSSTKGNASSGANSTGSASTSRAPQNMQQAIYLKQRALRTKQRRENGIGPKGTTNDADSKDPNTGERSVSASPHSYGDDGLHTKLPNLPPATTSPDVCSILLQRHLSHTSSEKNGEQLLDVGILDLPFIRLSGDANVRVLKSFLQKKLSIPPGNRIEISTVLGGKPMVLADRVKVEVVTKRLTDVKSYRDSFVPLTYKIFDGEYM